MQERSVRRLWRAFAVVLALTAAFFLWPTIQWYLFLPEADRAIATGPVADLRANVKTSSTIDVQRLLAADPAGPVPAPFRYLAAEAATHLEKHTSKPPSQWTTGDLLGEFPERTDLAAAVETHNRARVFALRGRSRLVIGIGREYGRGIELTVRADFTARASDQESRQKTLEDLRNALSVRAAAIASASPAVVPIGDNQLIVRIPGARDPDLARSLVETRGQVAFQLVDEHGLNAVRAYLSGSGTPFINEAGTVLVDPSQISGLPDGVSIRGVYTHDEYGLPKLAGYTVLQDSPAISGAEIIGVTTSQDPITGSPTVNFIFSSRGGEEFYRLTSASIGKRLAVCMDGRVMAQAKIQEPIRDQVRVNGFSEREASDLALVLRTGSLPVRLQVVSERVIR